MKGKVRLEQKEESMDQLGVGLFGRQWVLKFETDCTY